MERDCCCDGCRYLAFQDPVNRYDVFTAECHDAEKPALGKHRTIAVSGTSRPLAIQRPVWCRGKRLK